MLTVRAGLSACRLALAGLWPAAESAFRSFAATKLLGVAVPSLEVPDPAEPWAATPAVLLARAVNAALESVDDADGPWELSEVAGTLPGGPRHSASTWMSCRRWCCASACLATPARPWAGPWRHAAKQDSRRCSRSVSSAVMTRRCALHGCGSARTRSLSRRPGGVRIASAVGQRVPWRSWRYDSQAYAAAVSAAHPLTPLAALVGEPAATPWDPELAAVMSHRNVRIEEELTLDALLQDLSC